MEVENSLMSRLRVQPRQIVYNFQVMIEAAQLRWGPTLADNFITKLEFTFCVMLGLTSSRTN